MHGREMGRVETKKLGKREEVSSNESSRDDAPLKKKCDDGRYEHAYTRPKSQVGADVNSTCHSCSSAPG